MMKDNTLNYIQEKCVEVCDDLNISEFSDKLYNTVVSGYTDNTFRKYHNLDHIKDCLLTLECSKYNGNNLAILKMALLFHDIVYVPGRFDNEFESSKCFLKFINKLNIPKSKLEFDVYDVRDLILITDHFREEYYEDLLGDENHFLYSEISYIRDIDLSGLGNSLETYYENEKKVREEFLYYVDTYTYWKNRIKFLKNLLSRDCIFETEEFFNEYENQAINNMYNELGRIYFDLDH